MVDTSDGYIKSLKDSELKLLLPERLETILVGIRDLPTEEKQQLFNAMHEFVECTFLKKTGERKKWRWFFTKRKSYSIVPSESAPEILANGFKNAIRSLGPEYYKEVHDKASKAYKKHISRKRTPAMWLLKFLEPIIRLKDVLFNKKK